MRTAGEGDRELIHSMEADAAATAVLTTVLSRSDADFMVEHLMRAGGPVLRPRVNARTPISEETVRHRMGERRRPHTDEEPACNIGAEAC